MSTAAVRDRLLVRGVARTLLATAELSILVSTSSRVLFARPPDPPAAAGCDGLRGATLWCLPGGDGAAAEPFRWAAVALLVVVAAGYRPRWTCLPHCWVAFSLHANIAYPNGGEHAAQLAALLLVPACLGDRRRWHWGRAAAVAPGWTGAARAAQLAVRFQLLVIYAWAAAAKLTQPAWRDGTALRAILRDPIYGAAPVVRPVTDRLLDLPPVAAAATWGVLAMELAIALAMLGGLPVRGVAVGLAVLLHSAIIVFMGLFAFGLIMIAFVLLSCAGISPPGPPGERRTPLAEAVAGD